jgi:hypothetical protein
MSDCPGPSRSGGFDDPTLYCPAGADAGPADDEGWDEYCRGCRAGAEHADELRGDADRDEAE